METTAGVGTPQNLVLGTAGHIDHGKTALVSALTGIETDRLPAEKQRGITIDIGFAHLDLGAVRLAIVDVPGHERFVRNMLAGATGFDLALLVVAADDSIMPQTREHLEILRLLGLSGGAIALTKCDLADADWLELVEEDIRTLVAETFLAGAPIVRTSVQTGQGLSELRSALDAVCSQIAKREDTGLFRLAIDRAFTVPGHGAVVTGTVASGSVAVGDELEWLPAGRAVRVRALQRHDQPVERVGRGARAAINLAGVHHSELERGHELAAPGNLAPSRVLTVDLAALGGAPRPLRHRARYRVHLGTAELTATLALFDEAALLPGTAGLGQLLLSEPVAAVYGQPFVLREESPQATAGGGTVLMPGGRRVRRRDRPTVARLHRLRTPNLVERAAAALALRRFVPRTIARSAGLREFLSRKFPRTIERLAETGVLLELNVGAKRGTRLLAERITDLEARILRTLGRLLEARPRLSAIPRTQLLTALADVGDDALIAALIDRLHGRGDVVALGRAVSLKGHHVKLSQGEQRLKAELAETIRAGGLSPPDAHDFAARAGPRAGAVPDLLALLCEEERIVEVAPGLFLDSEVERAMRERVAERLKDGSALTMAELRDLLGTSRKYAVPVGEHLDRIGLTRREGDVRRLGTVPP